MPADPTSPASIDLEPTTLRIEDVSVARGGVAVLSHLDVAVAPGQALILRGPNGAGKTTLLRTLAGLQPALCGRIRPGPEAIAYASHADGLKATLSVVENLRFWARVHGHDAIGDALAAFDLTALRHRTAGSLSAGQKRRIGLARMALTHRPIWLLDEPTVSLDAASVALFAAAVRGHLAHGGLAVIATHIDLGLAEARVLDLAPLRSGGRQDAAPGQAGAFDDDEAGAFL